MRRHIPIITPARSSTLEDFEEINSSEALYHLEPNQSNLVEPAAITKADLEKLYQFSTSLLQQHARALQKIHAYESEKLHTKPSLQDMATKQDQIHALCIRLATTLSLDGPDIFQEEGFLPYVPDCIKDLQRHLDIINLKIDRAPKTSSLNRRILKGVTNLENALLRDTEGLQQDGLLGYLCDEVFNLIQQVVKLEKRFEGLGGPLQDREGRNSYLHSRVDSCVQSLAEISIMQAKIGDQILEAEINVKNIVSRFEEEMHQRLDVLEGRVESLGTLEPAKSMSEFVTERTPSPWNVGSAEYPEIPSSPSHSITCPGADLQKHNSVNSSWGPLKPDPTADPQSSHEKVNEWLNISDRPTENVPPSFTEQPPAKRKFSPEISCENNQRSPPTSRDTTAPKPLHFTYTIRRKPTPEKKLPPFISPSKSSLNQSQQIPTCIQPTLPPASASELPRVDINEPTQPPFPKSPQTSPRNNSLKPDNESP